MSARHVLRGWLPITHKAQLNAGGTVVGQEVGVGMGVLRVQEDKFTLQLPPEDLLLKLEGALVGLLLPSCLRLGS